MSGNLLEKCNLGLQSQKIDAVKALLAWKGISSNPLPEKILLTESMQLTLSSERIAYYVTTAKECSCKAGQYGRLCKHRRSLGSEAPKMSASEIQRIPESVISDPILCGYDGPSA